MLNAALVVVVLMTGTASQYGRGVAERTIAVRQANPPRVSKMLPQELPGTDGYIAVLECEHIGEIWYLRNIDTGSIRSFLVIDCAGDAPTRNWMIRDNIVGEIDWRSAVEWDTVRRGVKVERVVPSLYEPY